MAHDKAHEDIYFPLMMEALDAELPAADQLALETHLRACPECRREWNALLSIDMLFRQSPILSPAADFAERTVALLPNRRVRLAAIAALYGVLLLGGLLPLVIAGVFIARYLPLLSQPELLGGVFSTLTETARVFVAVIDSLLTGAAHVLTHQPALIGGMLLLVGVVFLWGGVVQRLVLQPGAAAARS